MKSVLLASVLFASGTIAAERTYVVVGTGQTKCYDNFGEIVPPKPGQPFYGQDAQFPGPAPSYQLRANGLTVHDNNTGLTWQRSPDINGDGKLDARDKLTFAQAQERPAQLNTARFGGFNDWRLPTIKELYSLILFSGVDPSGPDMTKQPAQSRPFIDTRFFQFAYGDTSAGERVIDSQWATSTCYVTNPKQMFGVNFADGRIKGYPVTKTFFVLCVRGNPLYGRNDFHDNGDGTITDRATGLVWQKNDSGRGMNWEQALAYAASLKNGWRLPNAKELQSIVDYTRSPDTTGSAAIHPIFHCTAITNEVGKLDYPFYWTSTTHASSRGGWSAVYLAFGRAAGWIGRPSPFPDGPLQSGQRRFMDVHGAGAQRSDPKVGNPAHYPQGRGPQGDVVRIYNFIRCVRGGVVSQP